MTPPSIGQIPGANFKFALAAAVLFLLGLVIWGLGGLLGWGWIPVAVAAALWGAAFVLSVAAVAKGSIRDASTSETLFKVLVATIATSPILIVGALVGGQPWISPPTYVAILGATSVLTGAFYAAMLKANVDGWRKDALQLALVEVGLIGALTTAVGATMA